MLALDITSRPSAYATEFEWAVGERTLLSEVIANVALGQVEHAMSILSESLPEESDTPTIKNVEEAVKLLMNPDSDHRDGWLFQVISWAAYNLQDSSAAVRAPHPTATRQGFDGVSVRLNSESNELEYVMVSEDKATDDPRNTFTQKVLRQFKELQSGQRESELRAEIVALLKSTGVSPSAILKTSDWRNRKRFRAAIATSEASLPPIVELFKDFETTIDGPAERRNANRFVHPDMRAFCQSLSEDAVVILKAMKTVDHV